MRDQDLEMLCRLAKKHFSGTKMSFTGHSPDQRETDAIRALFPQCHVESMYKKDWDLYSLAPRSLDIVWATNVFMYSPNPSVWMANVLDSCKYFILIDNTKGWRGGGREELGSDGDAMRYYLEPHTKAVFSDAYNLGRVGSRIIDFQEYKFQSQCGVPGFEEAVAFGCVLKGFI